MASPNNMNNEEGGMKYKGVRKRKWGKWVCEVRLPNSRDRIWLGSYDSPDKAARAFDAALYCLRGSRANFNFPDTPLHFHHLHHHPQSLTHDQIREIAVRFANQAPPSPSPSPPHQEEEPLHKESGSPTSETTGCTSYTYTSSSTSTEEVDWSFLKMLENSNDIGSSDYSGFYSELDDLHHFHSASAGAGEFDHLYPTPLSPFHFDVDHNAQESNYHDAFSHQSLTLWNF